MLADHRGKLEAVEIRHANVDQHDGDVVLQEKLQGFARRRRLDQVLVELAENDFIGQKLVRLIVDQQDVDFFPRLGGNLRFYLFYHDHRLNGAATSATRTGAVRY